jgi:hypothetical protein
MESVVEPATLRTQIESVTQAILETNMLCRPTTLVSVVSETRLARPQTRFRITIHCSLNGIAERNCASSDTAHAAQKQNASDRKTDMLCRPTTLVSIVSEMRLARKISREMLWLHGILDLPTRVFSKTEKRDAPSDIYFAEDDGRTPDSVAPCLKGISERVWKCKWSEIPWARGSTKDVKLAPADLFFRIHDWTPLSKRPQISAQTS